MTYIVHDVPDPSKPETWKWMFSLTWPDKDSPVPVGAEAIRQDWVFWAEQLAEPFRSAYMSIAPSATIWCDRLAEWRTESWNNRNGQVTLAGDAAHPMTYRKYLIDAPEPLSCTLILRYSRSRPRAQQRHYRCRISLPFAGRALSEWHADSGGPSCL